MYETIISYVFKVTLCSCVLALYYQVMLCNKRFHYYNRFYLLISVLLSLALPLLKLPALTFKTNNDKVINMLGVIYADDEANINFKSSTIFYEWQHVLVMLMFGISFLLLLLQVCRIIKIYHLKKQYPIIKMTSFDFINTDLKEAPFSFLKNIFWRNDITLEEAVGNQILQHEVTHVHQKHTWDKLFMQFVLSMVWINPFFWLMRRELYLVHEFIADEKAIENKDVAAFASMLLHAQYGSSIFAPAQSFFYSSIKRRLTMLTTSNAQKFGYVRRIMALPLFGIIILLFAFRLQRNEQSAGIAHAGTPFKLVVDAGHGGKDNGAIGLNGVLEKNITLAVSKKIMELSAGYGVDVVLTRDEDVYMSPSQKSDFANAQNANAFISIHVDAEDKNPGEKSGFTTFISPDNSHFEESKLLGSAVMQTLAANFEAPANLSKSKTGIWVLKASAYPAILIECGYLTNPSDVQMITNQMQVELMARKILEGVALYANHATTKVLDLKPVEEIN